MDEEGGDGFEFVNHICAALKNYCARDPDGMLSIGEGQTKTYLALTHHFIHRCLQITRKLNDSDSGTAVLSLIISLFENMHGRLDNDLPNLLKLLGSELDFVI